MTTQQSTTETKRIQVWPSGRMAEYTDEHTADRDVRLELRAERYSDREIYCCDSMLVNNLLKVTDRQLADAFSFEEIRNLYPDPDHWDAAQCVAYLEDHGIQLEDHGIQPDRYNFDPDYLTDVRGRVRDHAEPADVMEWWRVSQWLCDQLDAIGEVTVDNDYGCWFGRTCTGQGLIMDGTLQRVAARLDDA